MKQTTSLSSVESPISDSKAMDFHSATGKLDYTLTNDYLFKSLLQKNRKILKALVASLMHLKINEITSIEITNPIELGSSVTDKTFNLDIRLILNENTIINLDYSDFRFIPINLSKDHFHATSIQVCRNNYSNNLVQAGQ